MYVSRNESVLVHHRPREEVLTTITQTSKHEALGVKRRHEQRDLRHNHSQNQYKKNTGTISKQERQLHQSKQINSQRSTYRGHSHSENISSSSL